MVCFKNQKGFSPFLVIFFIALAIILLFLASNWINSRIDRITKPGDAESTKIEFNPDQWRGYEQLKNQNAIKPVERILEVSLDFINNEKVQLHNGGTAIKNGYPQKELPESYKYYLALKDKSGYLLAKRGVLVPDKIIGPPPLPGEESKEELYLPSEIPFTVTTKYVEGLDHIDFTNLDNKTVATIELSDIRTSDNQPNFNSIIPDPDADKKSYLIPSLMGVPKTFAQSSPKERLDITFIGDDYPESEMSKFKTEATSYANYLLTYEPFRTRVSDISFNYVENTKDLECKAKGRLLYCNYAKVMQAVNDFGAPNEQIVVVVNTPVYGGSGGPISVTYNGDETSKRVLVHEIGHTLGHLNDEYISEYGVAFADTNCYHGAPPNMNWDGIVKQSQYFKGCSSKDWYRSSEGSIMKTLDSEFFNDVSQKWLNYYIDLYSQSPSPSPSISISPSPTSSNNTPLLATPSPISMATQSANTVKSPIPVPRPLLRMKINGLYSYATVKVPKNASVEIEWDTETGTTRCTASGDWSGDKPVNGREVIKNIEKDQKYYLTCFAPTHLQERWVAVKIE